MSCLIAGGHLLKEPKKAKHQNDNPTPTKMAIRPLLAGRKWLRLITPVFNFPVLRFFDPISAPNVWNTTW